MCLLSRHNHYRRYFSRPPEANSLSTKRRGIFPSFRPGYFGPGPLALVSFPAGALRPGHYAPAPSAPRDRHPRPPAWQGPARRLSPARVARSANSAGWRCRRVAAGVGDRHRGSMAGLSRGWRRGRAGGTDAGVPEAKPVTVRAPPRPSSIGGRRGPAFRFVLVSALRGRCPWLSVRASGREPVGTEPNTCHYQRKRPATLRKRSLAGRFVLVAPCIKVCHRGICPVQPR